MPGKQGEYHVNNEYILEMEIQNALDAFRMIKIDRVKLKSIQVPSSKILSGLLPQVTFNLVNSESKLSHIATGEFHERNCLLHSLIFHTGHPSQQNLADYAPTHNVQPTALGRNARDRHKDQRRWM
jgi:hypothetical protein